MERLNNKELLATLLLIFSLTIIVFGIHNDKSTLKIIVKDSGRIYTYSVDIGDEIVLHYTHSIYMKDIYEFFEVGSLHEFILRKIIIGNNSHNRIELKDLEEYYMNAESLIIEGLNMKFKTINIRVGEIGKPTITINNYKLNLYDIAEFGSLIIITIDSN